MPDVAANGPVILVQSHNFHLGDALRAHATDRMTRIASRFFGKIDEAHIHFRREGSSYTVTGTWKTGALTLLSAQAENVDIHRAFAQMIERMNRQTGKLKNRLRDSKPVRTDKVISLDGEVRTYGQRGRFEQHEAEHRPGRLVEALEIADEPIAVTDAPLRDMLTRKGVEGYVDEMRRVGEAASNDDRRATDEDIAEYRRDRLPIAAE